MKKVFNLTNKYIVLATPLLLFSLISSVYLIFASQGNIFNILLLIIMTAAFLAGWFNMVKSAVNEPDLEFESLIIKDFTPGVGEYFLPVLGSYIIIFLFFIGTFFLTVFVGKNIIGELNISLESLLKASETVAATKAFLMSLSAEEITKLQQWNLLFLLSITGSHLLIMFYYPAMFFKTKNPIKAFYYDLKDLFSKKFFKSLGVFALIFISYFVITLLSYMAGKSLGFLMMLINFYFIIIATVGVFYFYYTNFLFRKDA